ncbi:MAG: tRNA G18 (ribose-2'-O)-methylase SpoU [Marivirga sp.]|jgi:tRNA G18 (ribose-2'-O)-methylase SpoU
MSLQKSHEAVKNARHEVDITVVAENIRTPENLGMILRVAEAFGVRKIYFVGIKGVNFTTKAKRAARNTHTLNNFEFLDEGVALLRTMKKKDAEVVALEITSTSLAIDQAHFNFHKPIVFLIGSEREGISEPLLQLADQAVHIKMYGSNSSINVTNALSIALHQLLLKSA